MRYYFRKYIFKRELSATDFNTDFLLQSSQTAECLKQATNSIIVQDFGDRGANRDLLLGD